MQFEFTESLDGRRIDYTIAGTKQKIVDVANKIMKSYDPRGYGTTFFDPVKIKNGEWRITGYRYTNCD